MPIGDERLLRKVGCIDDLKRLVRDHGNFFFENAQWHKSKPIAVMEHRLNPQLVVWAERYRTATMVGVVVQTPHVRIFSIDKLIGEIEELERTTSRKYMKALCKHAGYDT